MKYFLTLQIIALIILGSSCSKTPLITFVGERDAYFAKPNFNSTNELDSIVISFGFEEDNIKDSILVFPIKLIGPAFEHDVNFKVTVETNNNDANTKIFEILNNGIGFKAGEYQTDLKIKIFRPSSDNKKDPIILKIMIDTEGSELKGNFISSKDNTRSKNIRIFVDDILLPPNGWVSPPGTEDGVDYYLGPFSKKKLKTLSIIDPDGWTTSQIYHDVGYSGYFYGYLLYEYLEEQKSLGNIILDDDKTEMTAGLYFY